MLTVRTKKKKKHPGKFSSPKPKCKLNHISPEDKLHSEVLPDLGFLRWIVVFTPLKLKSAPTGKGGGSGRKCAVNKSRVVACRAKHAKMRVECSHQSRRTSGPDNISGEMGGFSNSRQQMWDQKKCNYTCQKRLIKEKPFNVCVLRNC